MCDYMMGTGVMGGFFMLLYTLLLLGLILLVYLLVLKLWKQINGKKARK